MKKKILSLLVLLVAAVSGAWAQTVIGNGWSDDFEGATCKWNLINGSAANKWTLGTATNNGGTQAIYISNDGGTTNTYVSGTGYASTVYAAKLFTFANDEYTFSYDWKANGENNYDYLRVALVPSSVTLTAMTTSTDHKSTLPTGWIALDGGSQLGVKTDWQSKSVTIDVSAGDYYMVFEWINDASTNVNPPAAIDNVSITPSSASSGPVVTFALAAAANEHGTVAFTDADGNEITTAAEGDVVTVSVTPATGYAVDEITGKWYAAVAASRRIPAAGTEFDLLSDITLTAGDVDETTGAATYTFTMERANVQFDVTYKHRHIWDFSVSPDGTQLIATCQNQSGDCDVQVEITEIALPEELVYGVDCEAGVDLEAFNEALGGEAEAELVSAVYTGTLLNGGDVYGPTTEVPTLPGEYTVTVTVSAGGQDYVFSRQYTLNQKVIDNLMIQPIADCVYDGQVQSPDVVVKYGDIVLTLGTDYVVRYSENVNAGVGTVAVYGIENYDGVSYGTFNILKKELTADMIEVIADQSYTGQAVEPAVVVKYSDNLVDGRVYVLEPGHDYTVSYENNVEVGTATVIVTAADGNYSGEVKATFNIVGTTGISAANSQQPTANRYYDLGGRKAKATKKGIVIVDGKKILKR